MSSAKWGPFSLGLNVLTLDMQDTYLGNIGMYLHCIAFLKDEMVQVIESFTQGRQVLAYPI